MIAVERRSTVRGQAAAARKKIASMQLEDDQDDNDDDDEDDEEQFKTLFTRRKPKKSKDKAKLSKKKSDNLSDISVGYLFKYYSYNFDLFKDNFFAQFKS